MFIDTHTHLYLSDFKNDIDTVIQKAIDVGVQKFILPAIDDTHTAEMTTLYERYPNRMMLMAGLHPCSVQEYWQKQIEQVEQYLDSHSCCAIGEIGIDLYWDQSLKQQQIEAFHTQIQLAKKHHLPIAIHCREAFDEVLEALEKEKSETLRGVVHCFTGNQEQALQAISCGMSLGIGGVITFKNCKLPDFLSEIDLQHIVLETDAPYLAPTPYRGKRNESSYIPIIAEKLASIYHTDLQEIEEQTTINALKLFK